MCLPIQKITQVIKDTMLARKGKKPKPGFISTEDRADAALLLRKEQVRRQVWTEAVERRFNELWITARTVPDGGPEARMLGAEVIKAARKLDLIQTDARYTLERDEVGRLAMGSLLRRVEWERGLVARLMRLDGQIGRYLAQYEEV